MSLFSTLSESLALLNEESTAAIRRTDLEPDEKLEQFQLLIDVYDELMEHYMLILGQDRTEAMTAALLLADDDLEDLIFALDFEIPLHSFIWGEDYQNPNRP